MSEIKHPFIFIKVFHLHPMVGFLYALGNSFRITDGFDYDSYFREVGFTKQNDLLYTMQLNDDTQINVWVWPMSIWVAGDEHLMMQFLENVCRQFGGKNCERFKKS